jgi:hypothetical protein
MPVSVAAVLAKDTVAKLSVVSHLFCASAAPALAFASG